MVEKPKAKKIVALKVYKGVEMLQKPDGSVHNETQYIKTEHGTNEWACLMKFLNSSNFITTQITIILQRVVFVF